MAFAEHSEKRFERRIVIRLSPVSGKVETCRPFLFVNLAIDYTLVMDACRSFKHQQHTIFAANHTQQAIETNVVM